LALLQKWREKHGPNATYRNLTKSFYDSGRFGLVETVCVVMTCDYPESTPQVATLHGKATLSVSTKILSLACISFLICLTVAMSSVLLALYFFEADNSRNGNHFLLSSVIANRGDTECTELE